MKQRELVKLLMKFCCRPKVDSRKYLHRPWSAGAYTYASNGHILIRVKRIKSVRENKDAPTRRCNRILRDTACIRYVKIPARLTVYSHGIRGNRGFPDGVFIGAALLSKPYLALIRSLPGGQLTSMPFVIKPSGFKFDHGVGAIMPMRQ